LRRRRFAISGTRPLRLCGSTSQFQGIFSSALTRSTQGGPSLRTLLFARFCWGPCWRRRLPRLTADTRADLLVLRHNAPPLPARQSSTTPARTNLGRAVRQAGADQSLRAPKLPHHRDAAEFWRSLPNQGLATQISRHCRSPILSVGVSLSPALQSKHAVSVHWPLLQLPAARDVISTSPRRLLSRRFVDNFGI